MDLLSEFGKDALNTAIVTQLVVGRHIGDSGALSTISTGVKPAVISHVAKSVGIRDLLERGKGQNDERELATLEQDAILKFIGAVCLCADIPSVIAWIAPAMHSHAIFEAPQRDAKSLLQERAASARLGAPLYRLVASAGPDHERTFTTEVTVGRNKALGTGSSKKDSERHAAAQLLQRIGSNAFSRAPGKSVVLDFRDHNIPSSQGAALCSAERIIAYRFQERCYLSAALTHPSYVNEARNGPTVHSYRTLATLGSFVLRALLRSRVVCDPEPWWSRTVDSHSRVEGYILSDAFVASVGRKLGLCRLLATGRGETGPRGDPMEANVVQACVAAAYIDLHTKLAAPQLWSLRPIVALSESQLSFRGFDGMIEADPKTLLQEVAQLLRISFEYTIVGSRGPDHASKFLAEVVLGDGQSSYRFASDPMSSKNAAEGNAAVLPLRVIGAVARGPAAIGTLIDLNAASSTAFIRFLMERLLVLAKGGPAVWSALRDLDLFGAPAVVAGSVVAAREALGRLWDVVSLVCPARIDELAALIIGNVRRADDDVRVELRELAQRVVQVLHEYQLGSTQRLQRTTVFRDLLLAATLGRRPAGTTSSTTGRDLLSGLGVMRECTVQVAPGFVDACKIGADLGHLLELVRNICLDESDTKPTAVRVEARGQEVSVSVARRGPPGLMDDVHIALLRVLATPAALKVNATEVEVVCPGIASSADPKTAWVDMIVLGLWAANRERDPVVAEFARAAHDLKNVMLAVDNHVQNAEEYPGQRFRFLAAAEESFQRARAASRTLTALGQRLPAADYRRFSVGPFLKSFAADLHQRVPDAVALQVTHNSVSAEMVGDEDLLYSALDNLSKNAIEALGAHGTLRLEWLADTAANSLLVELSDDGPGIPDDVIRTLAAGEVAPTIKTGGAGLGLLSASRIVRLHGGELAVRRGHKGTVCTVSLPLLGPEEGRRQGVAGEPQVVERGTA
jgi:dsRNA-specific ribonuclease